MECLDYLSVVQLNQVISLLYNIFCKQRSLLLENFGSRPLCELTRFSVQE